MTTRRVIGASSAEANVSEEQPPRDPMDVIIEMREQFEAAMYEISRYYELKNAEIERVDRARAAAKSLMEAMEK